MAKKEKPPSSKAPGQPEAEALQARERERERKNFVEVAAGAGMPLEEIGLLLVPALTVDELKVQFAVELEMGPAKANLEITSKLLTAARGGNVGAMIYWTKARMGWTEKGPEAKDKPPESETTPARSAMPTAEALTSLPLHPRPGLSIVKS